MRRGRFTMHANRICVNPGAAAVGGAEWSGGDIVIHASAAQSAVCLSFIVGALQKRYTKRPPLTAERGAAAQHDCQFRSRRRSLLLVQGPIF